MTERSGGADPDGPERKKGGGDAGSDDRKEDEERSESGSEDRSTERKEERSDDEDEGRKPISVRDLMPAPSGRPQRREKERRAPERRRAPPEKVDAEEEAEGEADAAEPDQATEESVDGAGAAAPQPTPVREVMEPSEPSSTPTIEEAPSRTFDFEGEEWTVRVGGRSISGTRPDAGAVLMHLSFFRAPDLDAPRRELLTVDRPLDALYEEDLRELLERSRPTTRDDESVS